MILDKTVIIQSPSTVYDDEGMPTNTWTANQTTIQANIQPLGGELAYKDYGISEAGITKLMFTGVNAVIQAGLRVVNGSKTYNIYSVEEFPTHYECPLKPV
jgi:hypothetical protein